MFAEVIIEYPVKSLDKVFTYKISKEFYNIIKVGMKVLVPFGNNEVNGFVLNIKNSFEDTYKLKEITDIVDRELILNSELLALGKYMKDRTLCSTISAYQSMLPSSYKAKTNKNNYNIYDTFIFLNKERSLIEDYIKSNKKGRVQNEILQRLLEENKIEKKNLSTSSVESLLKKNLVKEEKIQKYRLSINDYIDKEVILNSDQEKVCKSVNLDKNDTYLLYGITGSGKTEVYLKLIEDVIKNGKTAVMLVSEISLTMQIVKRFYAKFKDSVAVFHSALSEGEKHDEYLKIINKKIKVVVGTRSAVFTPLENIGIIIIDEEHSETYKQDNNPRYNAKDMADFRCKYHNAPFILGSATPTLDSMARSSKGVYKLLVLDKRAGNAKIPNVKLIDMEPEIKKHNYILSTELKTKMEICIKKDEQIILFLNRRGFSTFINCSACGYVYKCPNCDITLTYHKSSNNLICHYCGHLRKKDDLCPECHEDGLKFLGLGTEKLEEYLNENIAGAKVIRMDQDTTTKKGSHDKIIESFKNKEYNILLGTQMISKGLDFKDVTLVGVINADTSLNIPDYKANENTFSLLCQVAGRAGRSDKEGEVIVQTFNPDNNVLECVKNGDYKSFYLSEMIFRQKLRYPPYYYLAGIKVISKEYNLALEEAKKVVKYLKTKLKEEIILGPTTASILKHNNNYRFQIIVKYKKDINLFISLKELDKLYNSNNKVSLEIDINPNKI